MNRRRASVGEPGRDRTKAPPHRIWTWPIVHGVLSAVGLGCALVGDGWWDGASWVALGIPTAAALWYSFARSSRASIERPGGRSHKTR